MLDFSALKRQALREHFQRHLAGEVRFDDPTRTLYATDASHYAIRPMGVVIPRDADDLATTVAILLETETPIIARGGGTSLSGQAIGAGVVIDCSKYLTRIGPVDVARRTVKVQPGVVLDQLNRQVAAHDLMFGAEVATFNRATLGGMIGNNSAGSRSLVYGRTVDHVAALDVFLADGTRTTLGEPTAPPRLRDAVRKIITANAREIDVRFPDIQRRVSGYNLPDVKNLPQRGLIPLVVGSEGTLAILAEAELRLLPKPRHRGLLVPQFRTLADAMNVLELCLAAKPTAVELMDALLIRLARNQRGLADAAKLISGEPAALFMVEFASDDAGEVSERIERLRNVLDREPGVIACVPAIEASVRDPLWALRSSAVPLLYGMPGDRKPVTFCEDTAVAPERLPEFCARFRSILHAHGTDGAFYGHASVGCLHIRPVLNLKDIDDRVRMHAIMDDVTDLVLEFNGSLSGEHGDGLARSAYNRKMFGDLIYDAFRAIKHTFDPLNLLNPGKVVDGPLMTENLRETPTRVPLETVFDYSAQAGFFRSIEACNGAGVCRKTQGGTMCPSYRATHDERDSTRGRANALREALNAPGPTPLAERWLFDVMDLCISCKACKSECPANVDMAKLKAEFLHAYYARRTRPLMDRFTANIHRLVRIGSVVPNFLNAIGRWRSLRWLAEKIIGLDRTRPLPRLTSFNVRRHIDKMPQPNGRRVLLFDDCFTTFFEPTIPLAAVRILNAGGVQVERVNPICCGRPMISKGYLHAVRALVRRQAPLLAERIKDGTPILGLEPSCYHTLTDEWPELLPGPVTRAIAAAVRSAEGWIARELDVKFSPAGPVQLHPHCHQRALGGVSETVTALNRIPGATVRTLDAGCCGMAGAFGMEKSHATVSRKIAEIGVLAALDASPIVATGFSCRQQIRDFAGRTASHPLEMMVVRGDD